jgi:hypothetical protein
MVEHLVSIKALFRRVDLTTRVLSLACLPPLNPPSLPPLLALGWDAILKYENGTTAPSADDPLVIKPTAMSDAQMMGAVPSPSPDTSVESAQNAQRRVSYRDALANGMWRVRTAPLAFYIGDSAGTVSRLF